MNADAVVGIRELNTGATAPLRSGRDGSLIVRQHGGGYREAVDRGNVYGNSMSTGVASQAGLSGVTPIHTLYNPPGSKKLLVLLYAALVQSVAPAAAAVVWLGLHETGPAAKSVSALGTDATTVRNRKAGSTGQKGVGKALLACTASTPIAILNLGVLFAAALTVNNQQGPVGGWLDGSIILGEDTAVSFQTSTASGALGLFGDFIWEEIDN